MKLLKVILLSGLVFLTTKSFSQQIPGSYQSKLDEIVDFFKVIRGSNSITKGKTVLTVFSEEKIALRLEYKKQVKNLTFEKLAGEENDKKWKAVNQLTIDMINKHEDVVTKQLQIMYELAEEKSKE